MRPYNPLLRIPTLVLDDGEALIESDAILDEIDQMAGPERALVPPAGPERRRVMQLTAFALASMDRAQWAFYERRFRPQEKVHQPWIDHNESRSLAGLAPPRCDCGGRGRLARRYSAHDPGGYHHHRRRQLFRPGPAGVAGSRPEPCAFAARCEELFGVPQRPMPASQPGRPGVWIGSG